MTIKIATRGQVPPFLVMDVMRDASRLEAEGKRDLALARYHHYELASASFQIAIVVASASVITGVALLAAGGAAIGVLGIVFTGVGLLAPNAFHLF